MEVVDAHKGIASFETVFRGVPAHSSATHIGVSATHAGGRFVAFLDDLFAEYRDRARPDLGFVPPYTTIQVGIVNGGTANNIIAQDCAVDWHFRAMPTDDPAEIEKRVEDFLDGLKADMKGRHPDCDIATALRSRVPPLGPDDASPATALALALTGANATSRASFATEAGLFQGGRRAGRRVRSGRHRPGASARRVHRRRAARSLRGLPEATDGPDLRELNAGAGEGGANVRFAPFLPPGPDGNAGGDRRHARHHFQDGLLRVQPVFGLVEPPPTADRRQPPRRPRCRDRSACNA